MAIDRELSNCNSKYTELRERPNWKVSYRVECGSLGCRSFFETTLLLTLVARVSFSVTVVDRVIVTSRMSDNRVSDGRRNSSNVSNIKSRNYIHLSKKKERKNKKKKKEEKETFPLVEVST